MSEIVFRVVLPAYLALGIVALAFKRLNVLRRTGRDPIRARPFGRTDTAAGYAESVLVMSTVVLAVDVLVRAVWPRVSEQMLTVPLLSEHIHVRWAGLVLMSSGLCLYFLGLLGLGQSWRIGIDRDRPGPLVTGGLFGYIRHPLYSGILMATLGMAALTVDVLAIAAMAAAWTAVPIQARLEEEFLGVQYPGYAGYRSRTGRFLPRWRHGS